MGALLRNVNWASTPVGPIETWPQSLKTALQIAFASRLPMYIVWGRDYTQFYNDAFRPTLGDKHPASLGTPGRDTWREVWNTMEPIWESVWRGESMAFENYKLTINRYGYDEDCYFNFSYSPMPDDEGNVGGVLICCIETTEAVLLQQRLERQTNQLRRIFEHAPVGIAVLQGPELVYEVANDGYLQLVGHPDLLSKPMREALPELEGQGIFELLDSVYESGKEYAGRVSARFLRGRPAELKECTFQLVYQPVLDESGKSESIVVIAYEVTEAVNAQRAAESANRIKDEFLAMLGHELRNPLAPILTALNIMKMRGPGEAEEERLVIERQVRHVVGLVDDLLDVSRVARGKLSLKKEHFELAEAVTEAIEQCSPLLEQQEHRLRVEVAKKGLVINADPRRVAQIIANLVNNAAKYTERGGDISVVAEREGDEVRVRVKDNGDGIRPELLPDIFDLFYQEQQATDRSEGGLGLGLAIVKNLAEMHGGRVAAWSEGRGHGSEFTLWLPVSKENPVPQGAPAPAEPASLHQLRVLVVDDNVDAAQMLAFALRLDGHEARTAHDGPEALELLRTFVPHVAVLDIGLPAMDGYQLAGRMRENPALAHTKLVALTGYGQQEDLQRSGAAGFDAHLVKPVEIETLHQTLARVMGA